jgi:hypothetical protein
MDTLCPGKNFLPAHEEIVRVSKGLDEKSERHAKIDNIYIYTYWVIRVRHGVERTELEGEFVDDEVVGIILDLYEPSKSLLVLRANSQI